MSMQSEPLSLDDAALDARTATDEVYLGQLGYQQQLKRAIGAFSSFGVQFTMIAVAGGINLVFGIGLNTVGPLMLLAWIVAASLQIVVALAVADVCSAYPLAGGSYQIISRLARPWLGWQVGYWLFAAHIFAVSGEAVGLAVFVAAWFGLSLAGTWPIFLGALLLIAVCTVVDVIGIKYGAYINNVFGVFCEFGAIAIAILGVLVAWIVSPHAFHSVSYVLTTAGVVPPGQSVLAPFLFAMLVPAFVISGFDASGTAGEETKSAARSVPRGMVYANLGALVFGSVMIFLALLAMPDLHATATAPEPLRYALQNVLGFVPAQVFSVLAVLSLVINMMILLLTAARVLWAQARDGQLPLARYVGMLDADRVPIVAVLVSAVISVLLMLWTTLLTILVTMVALVWAAGYTVLLAVIIARKRRAPLPAHPYSNGRWGTLIDWVAFLWSLVLVAILVWSNVSVIGGGFLAVVAIGLVIYFVAIPSQRRGRLPRTAGRVEIAGEATATEA
ncbi:MAG TPA: amino acid permease [Candidatus Dormibacteraeota bacterium]|jgi:amino acid transporter